MRTTIYLAIMCAVAAILPAAMVQAGGAAASAAPQEAHAADPADAEPVRGPLPRAQEAALRTSLAQTAVVISRSSKTLELWYPVRLAFVPDATDLVASGAAMLDLLAHWLKQYEHTAVVVAVYTDAIGSSDFNLQQSQARAAAVVAYLAAKGIAPSRLVARGAGESAPLEAPNTPEGRELNRRLQLVITPLS